MKELIKEYEINATPQQVFQALTDPKIIENWSGSSATMSSKAGSKFSLWDGSIYGVNKEVTPTRIVQDWQEENWEKPSSVTFHISPKGRKTILELRHEGIPEKSFKSISSGWDEYYLGPLKELLEG